MKWYLGQISEAIATIKRENKSLIVFIYDTSETSKLLDKLLSENSLNALNHSICIKIQADSSTASQFSSVYKVEKIPSLHLILSNGVRAAVKYDDFIDESVKGWLLGHNELLANTTNQSHSEDIQQAKTVKPITIVEDQREREILDQIEQQKKDKILDTERCKKVKRQIEEDREETERRRRILLESTEKCNISAEDAYEVHRRNLYIPESNTITSDTTKLNFRITNGTGSCAIKSFAAEDTMAGTIRPWLKGLIAASSVDADAVVTENFPAEFSKIFASDFEFRQLRPPRRFDSEDEKKSLKQLGLCPSALLLLQPKSNSTISSNGGSFLSFAVGIVYSLSQRIWGITSGIMTSLFGNFGRSNQPASSANAPEEDKTKPEPPPNNRHIITQGRINRLSHRPDNSDEHARWNGNSTSQL